MKEKTVIIFLVILVILFGGFIGITKLVKKDDNDIHREYPTEEEVTKEEINTIKDKINTFSKMDFSYFNNINNISDEEKIWRIIENEEYIYGVNSGRIEKEKIDDKLKYYFGDEVNIQYVNLTALVNDYTESGIVYIYDDESKAYVKQINYYQNPYVSNMAVYIDIISVTKKGDEYIADVHKLTIPGCTDICSGTDADYYDGTDKVGTVSVATNDKLKEEYEKVKDQLTVHRYTLTKQGDDFFIKRYQRG